MKKLIFYLSLLVCLGQNTPTSAQMDAFGAAAKTVFAGVLLTWAVQTSKDVLASVRQGEIIRAGCGAAIGAPLVYYGLHNAKDVYKWFTITKDFVTNPRYKMSGFNALTHCAAGVGMATVAYSYGKNIIDSDASGEKPSLLTLSFFLAASGLACVWLKDSASWMLQNI